MGPHGHCVGSPAAANVMFVMRCAGSAQARNALPPVQPLAVPHTEAATDVDATIPPEIHCEMGWGIGGVGGIEN